jgi:hypothetical protein
VFSGLVGGVAGLGVLVPGCADAGRAFVHPCVLVVAPRRCLDGAERECIAAGAGFRTWQLGAFRFREGFWDASERLEAELERASDENAGRALLAPGMVARSDSTMSTANPRSVILRAAGRGELPEVSIPTFSAISTHS